MLRDALKTARGSLRLALARAGVDVRRVHRAKPPLQRDGALGLYETPGGRFWVPLDAKDDVIINAIAAGAFFEPEILDVASRFLRPGATVVDAGANFGQMTCAFSKLVGPGGRVHAIEAHPFTAQVLRRNVEENDLRNVIVHERAVHERSGSELHFAAIDFKRFASYGSYGIDPRGSGLAVTSLAIDDLELTDLHFIKIDVQGADLAALRGARRVFARHRPAAIFEFEQQFQAEFGTSFQDYVDLVAQIDYRFVDVVNGINYVITPRSS